MKIAALRELRKDGFYLERHSGEYYLLCHDDTDEKYVAKRDHLRIFSSFNAAMNLLTREGVKEIRVKEM